MNDQTLVEAYLEQIAPDIAPIMSQVARCESGYKQEWNSMNPTGDPNSKYSAYGYFQIVKGTALKADPTLDRFNPLENIELAVKIYRNEKTKLSDWQLSSNCWK